LDEHDHVMPSSKIHILSSCDDVLSTHLSGPNSRHAKPTSCKRIVGEPSPHLETRLKPLRRSSGRSPAPRRVRRDGPRQVRRPLAARVRVGCRTITACSAVTPQRRRRGSLSGFTNARHAPSRTRAQGPGPAANSLLCVSVAICRLRPAVACGLLSPAAGLLSPAACCRLRPAVACCLLSPAVACCLLSPAACCRLRPAVACGLLSPAAGLLSPAACCRQRPAVACGQLSPVACCRLCMRRLPSAAASRTSTARAESRRRVGASLASETADHAPVSPATSRLGVNVQICIALVGVKTNLHLLREWPLPRATESRTPSQ
jgi:hypothetical protein